MLFSSVLGSTAMMATLPGTLELAMLTLGGILPRRIAPLPRGELRKLAIVVPAHNEAGDIAQCIHSLLAADAPQAERLVLVIADNCTDDTATLASEAGAVVWERSDMTRRGKGFALEFAFERLLSDPDVDAVLVVDADTVVDANFITECEKMLRSGADGVQCRYLVKNPDDSEKARLMNTALFAFNVLRPRGRDRFGFSVGILGNGWGVSRHCLEQVPYNAHSVVEDLEYHIRLVRAGMSIRFIDTATVYGEMPSDENAAETQRARWEGGRFRMIREQVPALLDDLRHGRLRTLEPAGELLLFPLAYHVGGLALTLTIPFLPSQLYALSGLGLVGCHIAAAMVVGGGSKEDLKALLKVPGYILWKAGLLKKIFAASREDQDWVRTRRREHEASG